MRPGKREREREFTERRLLCVRYTPHINVLLPMLVLLRQCACGSMLSCCTVCGAAVAGGVSVPLLGGHRHTSCVFRRFAADSSRN